MGHIPKAKTPSLPPEPPTPETVHRTEDEQARTRGDAKEAAMKRAGVAGTNVTRGQLVNSNIETKKKTLGGA